MMIAIIITQAFQLLPLPEIHPSMELWLTRLKDAKEYKKKEMKVKMTMGISMGLL